ncbi:MAG: DUF4199 domain-containing protein [Candidatus Competibacteraceae bacterium]|nr:DUF4199 domain-containing protein [Candidatus Competibacteraceae bacterium]
MKSLLPGFGAALLFFLWKLILFFSNQQHHILAEFPAAPLMVFTFAAIAWVIIKYARTQQFSVIEAFKHGARVGLIAAVFSSIFVFAYYAWIDTDFLEIIRIAKMQEAEKVFTGEELENFTRATNFFNSPRARSLFTLSGMMIFAFLSALNLSLIARFTIVRKLS